MSGLTQVYVCPQRAIVPLCVVVHVGVPAPYSLEHNTHVEPLSAQVMDQACGELQGEWGPGMRGRARGEEVRDEGEGHGRGGQG